MKISIIMSTYKEEEKMLRDAIESMLKQTFKDFEYIIILDNPNNDNHIRIINEYAKHDKRIKFYINETNLGLSASLNKGIKLANGDYICRMDADDISLMNRLELEIKYLEEGNYDLIGGITSIIDEQGSQLYGIKNIPTQIDKIKKALMYNQCLAHPTWLGKRKLFKDLNGYRDIPLCEDYDFTLRAVLKGYKVGNINKIVLKYRMSSQSISRQNLYDQYLYMLYITRMYKNGKIAVVGEAKKFVKLNNNEKKAEKYVKANMLFNKTLNSLENKELINFFINGIKLCFCSWAYLNKIYRLTRVQLLSK